MTEGIKPSGTQSIERSISLLRLLSTRGKFGWGLTDLARRSGMDKATVHRILVCLERERMVKRDPVERRYYPGPLLVDLALSVSTYQPFLDAGREALARIVQRTNGVAFFYLRSDYDFVVAGRQERNVHRGMLNDVGYRRPLIMSAGGIAILMALPPDEREDVLNHNMESLRAARVPLVDRFLRMLEHSLELGYSANLEHVASGIHSFSVPILNESGLPLGALAVAGDATQFPASSGCKLATMLSQEAENVLSKVPDLAPAGSQLPAPNPPVFMNQAFSMA